MLRTWYTYSFDVHIIKFILQIIKTLKPCLRTVRTYVFNSVGGAYAYCTTGLAHSNYGRVDYARTDKCCKHVITVSVHALFQFCCLHCLVLYEIILNGFGYFSHTWIFISTYIYYYIYAGDGSKIYFCGWYGQSTIRKLFCINVSHIIITHGISVWPIVPSLVCVCMCLERLLSVSDSCLDCLNASRVDE